MRSSCSWSCVFSVTSRKMRRKPSASPAACRGTEVTSAGTSQPNFVTRRTGMPGQDGPGAPDPQELGERRSGLLRDNGLDVVPDHLVGQLSR